MPPCPSSLFRTADGWTGSRRHSWEGTPTPDWRAWIASAVVAGILSVVLGLVVHRFADTRAFFMEDGPVEMLQAALLGAVALVFATASWRSAGSRAFFCLVAAYGCVFALTREIPRCGSAFVGGDVCLPSTWKHSIVLLASGLGIAALVLRPIEWRSALSVSALRWIWPCLLVLGFLVAAEAMESLVYYSEIEEFLELVAYLHLGVFAIQILRRTTST